MCEAKENRRQVNGVTVETEVACNPIGGARIRAEAGTTGLTGNPSRDGGGRTVLFLDCVAGDLLLAPVTADDGRTGMLLAGCGDDALVAITEALASCLETLVKKIDGKA